MTLATLAEWRCQGRKSGPRKRGNIACGWLAINCNYLASSVMRCTRWYADNSNAPLTELAVFSALSAHCQPFGAVSAGFSCVYYLGGNYFRRTINMHEGSEAGAGPGPCITVVIMYITHTQCYHSKCCLLKIMSMTPHEALFSFTSHSHTVRLEYLEQLQAIPVWKVDYD